RLADGFGEEIAHAERATEAGPRLHLRIAIDYSSRDAIANAAACWLGDDTPSRAAFGRLLASAGGDPCAEVDILIRSGGEKRLADFLLWESAYAELRFVDTLWPEFGAADLAAAIPGCHHRSRRFAALAAIWGHTADPQR